MMAASGRTDPHSRVIKKDVTGVVRRFIKARGYGFITLHNDASDDVFFPITAVADDDRPFLKQSGEKSVPVMFDLLIETRGFAAARVRFIGKSADLNEDHTHDTQAIESLSEVLRKQGNLLSKALNDRQPAVERSSALREAIKWYQLSLRAAKSSQDGASAAKNAATASWKLASLYRENLELSTSDAEVVVKTYEEAMAYFTRALKDGHCKGETWTKQLEELMQNCLKEKHELLSANESQRNDTTWKGNCEDEIPVKTSPQPRLSISDRKRAEGNVLFKSATFQIDARKKGLCLKEALGLYRRALSASERLDEEVSAAKNIAAASLKLAVLYGEHPKLSGGRTNIHRLFKEAAMHLAKARARRQRKCEEWQAQLEISIQNCVDEFRSWLSGCSPSFTSKEKDSLWGEFLSCLPKCPPKAGGKVLQAKIVYNIGLKEFQNDAYQKCLGYLNKCANLLKEAETLCERNAIILTEIKALHLDIRHQRERAESCIARAAEFKKRREAEQRQAREREKCMMKLRNDLESLEALEAISMIFGPRYFLESLFEKWPPKCSNGEPSRRLSRSGSLRKDIIRAMSYYHPDKVDKEAHGSTWFCFCGEVTKTLSRLLEIVKSLEDTTLL